MAHAAIDGQDRLPAGTLLVTEAEAAKRLSISPRKLWELRNRGEIPHLRVGRAVRYDPKDLLAWIDSCKCGQIRQVGATTAVANTYRRSRR